MGCRLKKKSVYVAFLSLSMPWMAWAMGMQDIRIESFLNQPFKAEIPLFDVGNIPLSSIHATLADPDEFKRMGLERVDVLELLTFTVQNDAEGKPEIVIRSTERMVEPYLKLVVDLAWPSGQLYRAYDILLDPPGYALERNQRAVRGRVTGHWAKHRIVLSDAREPVAVAPEGVITRKEAVYGPTLSHETIWQIAQRYVTAETTLPQVILAIVGTNSQAFTQGNLNGLKTGERLHIPPGDEVQRIPQAAAVQEVRAHDKAWKNQEAIHHVLLPPYIDAIPGESQFMTKGDDKLVSVVVSVPSFSENVSSQLTSMKSAVLETGAQEKTAVADEQKQLQTIISQNKILQQQIVQRDKTIHRLKDTLHHDRIAPNAEPFSKVMQEPPASTGSGSYFGIFALLALLTGAGTYFYKRRLKSADTKPESEASMPFTPAPEPLVSQEVIDPESVQQNRDYTPSKSVSDKTPQEEATVIAKSESVPSGAVSATTAPQAAVPAIEPASVAPELPSLVPDSAPTASQSPSFVSEPAFEVPQPEVTPDPVDAASLSSEKETDLPPDQGEPEQFALKMMPLDKPLEEPSLPQDMLSTENQAKKKIKEPSKNPVKKEIPLAAANPVKLVKSTTALETLLALAETYISMEDFEAARQALEEVIQDGTKVQKQAARAILKELPAEK